MALAVTQYETLEALRDQHPVHYKTHMAGIDDPYSLSLAQARSKIVAIKKDVRALTENFAGSQRAIIKDWLIHAEGSRAERIVYVQAALVSYVGNWKGLTFSKNVGGQRRAKPFSTQQREFRRLVEQIGNELDFEGGPVPAAEEKPEPPKEKPKPKNKFNWWLEIVRTARDFCKQRNADGQPLDEIGLRPVEYGLKMLGQEIPVEACVDAMTMHWPAEARKALSDKAGVTVKEFDVTSFRKEKRKDGVHAALPYCMAVAEAGVPLALIGPKGTGKTTLAKDLADALAEEWGVEMKFGMVSMTSGTSPSAFNGRPRIATDASMPVTLATLAKEGPEKALEFALQAQARGDVVKSQWEIVYSEGGCYLLDEMDAADENLLLKINAPLANGYFSNDSTGEIVKVHKNFVPICGQNTLAIGATRDYNARNRLDAATLDRWNLGRCRITLDSRIEEAMLSEALAGNGGEAEAGA